MKRKVTMNLYLKDRETMKNLFVLTFTASALNAGANLGQLYSSKKNNEWMRNEIAKSESKVNATLIQINKLTKDYKKYKKSIKKSFKSTSGFSKKDRKEFNKILENKF